MMTQVINLLILIFIGEPLIHLLLFIMSKVFGKEKKDQLSGLSVFKGILERTFVVVTLYFDMASALTLLGALKIATRIKDTEDKISNDFFLIGNLMSVLFAVVYFVIIKNLIGL